MNQLLSLMMTKPRNWPESLPFLKTPLHSPDLSPAQVKALRTKPSAVACMPASSTPAPSPLVKIRRIDDVRHPAYGQYRLFATRSLKPGALIMAYLGRVHGGAAASYSTSSDYDLWLDRDADLAVDAAAEGHEARFVNDYRGISDRPNAFFETVWCEHWGQLCIGVWAGRGGKGIKKGEEILVSYGKGFWQTRKLRAQSVTPTSGEGAAYAVEMSPLELSLNSCP